MSRRIESLAQLAADVNRRLEDLEGAAGIRPAGIEERMSPLARRLRRDLEEEDLRLGRRVIPADPEPAEFIADRLRRRVAHLEEQLRTGFEAEEAMRRGIAELADRLRMSHELEEILRADLKAAIERINTLEDAGAAAAHDELGAAERINDLDSLRIAAEYNLKGARERIAELEEMLAEKTKGGRPRE